MAGVSFGPTFNYSFSIDALSPDCDLRAGELDSPFADQSAPNAVLPLKDGGPLRA
jgi:hypothetical protein